MSKYPQINIMYYLKENELYNNFLKMHGINKQCSTVQKSPILKILHFYPQKGDVGIDIWVVVIQQNTRILRTNSLLINPQEALIQSLQ